MSTNLSSRPNEVLLKIFKYVMQSNAPLKTRLIARLAARKRSDKPSPTTSEQTTVKTPTTLEQNLLRAPFLGMLDAYPIDSTTEDTDSSIFDVICMHDLCEWFTNLEGKPRCLCMNSPWPEHQADHLKDWVLANGISHRFRRLAKEASFTAKVFIDPDDFDQLRSNPTTAAVLDRSQEIIVTLPCCTTPSPWLSLRRYQQFENLRVLVLRPKTHPRVGNLAHNIKPEQLSQDPAPEMIIKALRDIGVSRLNLRIDMIRSKSEAERLAQTVLIEKHIFPSLAWVAQQKSKRMEQIRNGLDHEPRRQPMISIESGRNSCIEMMNKQSDSDSKCYGSKLQDAKGGHWKVDKRGPIGSELSRKKNSRSKLWRTMVLMSWPWPRTP
ncbi:MAG: hypothetical protein Q9169_005175 [Polycauliona sp. 2 TL-2023]